MSDLIVSLTLAHPDSESAAIVGERSLTVPKYVSVIFQNHIPLSL